MANQRRMSRTVPNSDRATPPRGGVYAALVLHQCNEQWDRRNTLNIMHEWAVRFNVQFKLHVPEITLRLDNLASRVGGQFRYGHNGLGLRGEITVNARYLAMPWWWLLSVLLHELLHGWQQAHGKPGHGNYHNSEFRSKAAEFGLVVDRDGSQKLLKDSRFFDLLIAHGVEMPEFGPEGDDDTREQRAKLEDVNRQKPKGQSKLKKWSCECTNVRCAVANFYAQCLRCGQVFRLQTDDSGIRSGP